MAKKKKSGHKKHSFSHGPSTTTSNSSTTVATPGASVAVPAGSTAPAAPSGASVATAHPALYGDVRRSIGLAVGLAFVQVVLWVLFTHTAVGPYIYGLVKL